MHCQMGITSHQQHQTMAQALAHERNTSPLQGWQGLHTHITLRPSALLLALRARRALSNAPARATEICNGIGLAALVGRRHYTAHASYNAARPTGVPIQWKLKMWSPELGLPVFRNERPTPTPTEQRNRYEHRAQELHKRSCGVAASTWTQRPGLVWGSRPCVGPCGVNNFAAKQTRSRQTRFHTRGTKSDTTPAPTPSFARAEGDV